MRLLVLVFALSLAAPVGAEPPEAVARPKKPVQAQQPAIVLASAETIKTPVQGHAASATARKVTPRVTTCRCGDPSPQLTDDQEQDDQEQ